MAVEKTAIRNIKSDSRLVCVMRWKGALLSWNLSKHIRGNYSEVVKRRAGLIRSKEDSVIKVSDSSVQCDEEDLKSLINYINSCTSNLFVLDTDNECVLVNLSIGPQATIEIVDCSNR